MTDRVYRFIPHSKREEAEAEGWRHSADLDSHHSAYAALYEKVEEEKPPHKTLGEPIVQIVLTLQNAERYKVCLMSANQVVANTYFSNKLDAVEYISERIWNLAPVGGTNG